MKSKRINNKVQTIQFNKIKSIFVSILLKIMALSIVVKSALVKFFRLAGQITKYPLVILIVLAAPIVAYILQFVFQPGYSEYDFTSNYKFHYSGDKPLKTRQLLPSLLAEKRKINNTLIMIYSSETSKNPGVIERAIRSAESIGSTKNVKVLMLYDKPSRDHSTSTESVETELLYITRNIEDLDEDSTVDVNKKYTSTVIETLGKANLGDPQTLYDFAFFAHSNFPATMKILIIDGVGVGSQGLLWDEASNDYLTQFELTKAVSELTYSGDSILDLLVLHSSFGAGAETIASLQKYVRYVIASPSYVSDKSMNYGQILLTANKMSGKTPTELATAIFDDAFDAALCESDEIYNLYTLKLSPNLENGLETFATSYLNDDSLNTIAWYNNTVANSKKLYESENTSPIYSLESFSEALGDEFAEETVQSMASKQLLSDIDNIVLKRSSCPDAREESLVISLVEKVDERLIKQFEEINYRSIIAFKEMIRQFPYKDEVSASDGDLTVNDSEKYGQSLLPNHQFCYRGLEVEDMFFIAWRGLGEIDKLKIICKKNQSAINLEGKIILPSYVNEEVATINAIVQMNNKNYLSDLNFEAEESAYKFTSINIRGNGVSDFAYFVELPDDYKFEFTAFGSAAKQNVNTGYYSPGKLEISSHSTLKKIDLDYRYGLSVVEERQSNETIKVYSESDNEKPLYDIEFDFFALQMELLDIPTIEDSIESNITEFKLEDDKIDFTRLDLLKPRVSQIRGFKYYEYILANKKYKSSKTSYHKLGYTVGSDIVYYSGSNRPSDENRQFWFKWLSSVNEIQNED